MKFDIITDRELREIAQVVGEDPAPLLELIRNLMNEVQAVVEDMADLRKEPNIGGSDNAPPIAPRD